MTKLPLNVDDDDYIVQLYVTALAEEYNDTDIYADFANETKIIIVIIIITEYLR